MDSSKKTRLSRRAIHESKKKLIYSLIGIVVVLFLLFKFGIPLLIRFSLFISNGRNGSDTTQTVDQPTFIAPPSLNPYATATNSAQIAISGNGDTKQQIKLYVNNQVVDSQSTDSKGNFSFNNVTLSNGSNTIQAKADINGKESDFSNTVSVSYLNKAPSLQVNSPSDGQSFAKDPSLTVNGKTDPSATVTVNDFQAIVDDSGNFSYTMQMQNGDNQLKVIASDAAGNKTEKDLKVTYSQ